MNPYTTASSAPDLPAAEELRLAARALHLGSIVRTSVPQVLEWAELREVAVSAQLRRTLGADPMTLSTRALGQWGETLAAVLLQVLGCTLEGRNVRLPSGEIDIIAQDGPALVYCEVKTRRTSTAGSPQAAVTPAKVKRLRRLVGEHLMRTHLWHREVRIDVLAFCIGPAGSVEIELIRGVI